MQKKTMQAKASSKFWILFIGILFLLSGSIGLTAQDQIKIIPGEYIVKLKGQKNDVKANAMLRFFEGMVSGLGGKVLKQYSNFAQFHHVKMDTQTMFSLVDGVQDIEYIEPVYVVHAIGNTNDDNFENDEAISSQDPPFRELVKSKSGDYDISDQWGLDNRADIDIDAEKAWKITEGSQKVVVAVIDSGIDYTHPALNANIWKNEDEIPDNGIDDDQNGFIDDHIGWDFYNDDNLPYDDNLHGTHCAGIIGANAQNLRGIAPNVRLMALKFLNYRGYGSSADAMHAVDYAISNGAKILSNSWGGAGYSHALKEMIEKSNQQDTLFIAAAGNFTTNLDRYPSYPASYKVANVITVASIDSKGDLSGFSNYGKTSVHVSAPGSNILSSVPYGGTRYLSGTSMATPFVAGIAALMYSLDGNLSNKQAKDIILNTAVPYNTLTDYTVTGGLANAANAVEQIATIPEPDPEPDPEPSFDSDKIVFKTSYYRPWWSSYYKVNLYLEIPDEYKDLIQSVTYTLDPLIFDPFTINKNETQGYYIMMFKSKPWSYKVEIKIQLENGSFFVKQEEFTF